MNSNNHEIELQIKKEIIELWQHKNKHRGITEDESMLFNDCAKIGAFLMDEKEVLNELVELNNELVKNFNIAKEEGERLFSGIKDDKGIYIKSSIKRFRNFIESFFVDNHGFSPQSVQLIDVIQPKMFNKYILKAKRLPKDSFFREIKSVEHGEFSHMIQWYVIAKHAKKINLHYPISDIYSKIGKLYKDSTDGGPMNIWDIIVDINPAQYSGNAKFRSAINLHEFLCHPKHKELKMLREIVSYRQSDEYLELVKLNHGCLYFKLSNKFNAVANKTNENYYKKYEVQDEKSNMLVTKLKN